MRIMHHFYNDVTDWLSVGADLDVASVLTDKGYVEVIAALRSHGVTHVLDLRDDWEDSDAWEYCGLPTGNYQHAPIVDSREHAPADEWFHSVEDFIGLFWRSRSEGDRLYVHCSQGINRGPSAAMIALLYTDPTLTPWEAFEMIRAVRPVAGVVYAQHVGTRHILSAGGDAEEVANYTEALRSYWTPEEIQAARDLRWWNEVDSVEVV